jgi:cytochrome P450
VSFAATGVKCAPRIRPLLSARELRRIARGWLHFIEGLSQYGDAVEWSIGPMRETLFFHPDAAGEIFAAAGANGPVGRSIIGGFQEYAGVIGNNGLVMSEGPFWRQQRRIMQPGMHKQRIAEYSNVMVASAEEMCDRWGDGGVLRIQGEMERLTRRIMTRTLFGADVTEPESDNIKRVMDRQLLFNSMEFFLSSWLPPRVPTPLRAALRASSDKLRALFAALVQRRLSETDDARSARDADLLDMLLEGRDEDDRPMADHQLQDELHNMFLGGYETSSNSLAVIAVLLGRDPGLQDRMAAEIVGAAGAGNLTFEHVTRLPVTEAVVKEALRLYPPIFALPGHIVKTPIAMGGYDLRPGQRIMVCPLVTHRDARWYADPLEFRPDRWLDGSTNQIPRFAWIPFGGGPRVCFGQPFAMAEMILALAVMVRRCTFSPHSRSAGEVKMKLSPSLMLKVKNDKVRVAPRA